MFERIKSFLSNLSHKEQKEKDEYTIIKETLIPKFGFKGWQIVKTNGYNNIDLILVSCNADKDENLVIKEMNRMGWFDSYILPPKVVNSTVVRQISFEPFTQKEINSLMGKWNYLYHLSPLCNEESILNKGLLPFSKNNKLKYPKRVYLIKPTVTQREILSFTKKLLNAKSFGKQRECYRLFKVDLNKIPKNISFYYDARYEFGIYTEDIIPKEAIIPLGIIKR